MVFGRKVIQGATVTYTTFNSLWELDDVRTSLSVKRMVAIFTFNSLWELDGVRTCGMLVGGLWQRHFQFPVGIRWCSDLHAAHGSAAGAAATYFNSPWELDGVRTRR